MIFKSLSIYTFNVSCAFCFLFSTLSLTDSWWGSWMFKQMISGNFHEMIKLDFFSIFFMIFSGMVVLSVFYFSLYYMNSEDFKIFFLFLAIFLFLMWILILGSNLMTVFIGWEGVGVMSFLLIGWFSSRDSACFSSKKAVLVNRFTDFFFFTLLSSELSSSGNIFLKKILFLEEYLIIFLGFTIVLSMMGKSAQFVFHPWLTSAMEGPTPVSSLLHSSTMVVAGVYLYIRMSSTVSEMENFSESLMTNKMISLIVCGTMLLMSFSGFFYKDYKKVIALSTTSQLSFMMILCSLGEKELAFLHMMLHSFFKASLFLFSGYVIHSNNSEQDFRNAKMFSENFFKTMFLTSSMGIMGCPFIGAFWSKHCFVSFSTNSIYGKWFDIFIISFSLISLFLTSGYSIRLMLNSNMFSSNMIKSSIFPAMEKNIFLNFSLMNLLIGISFFGFIIFQYYSTMFFIPDMSNQVKQYIPLSWLFILITICGLFLNFSFKKNSWMGFLYFFSMEMVYMFMFLYEKFSKLQLNNTEKNFFLKPLFANLNLLFKKKLIKKSWVSLNHGGMKSLTVLFFIFYFFICIFPLMV